MAPALTEPLNPADKLSSSTSSPNTRSSKRLDNSSPSIVTRERRNRFVNSPTNVTRRTRGRAIVSQASSADQSINIIPSSTVNVLVTESITDQLQCNNNNEQMGLSTAPISTNNNNNNNNNKNSTQNLLIKEKDPNENNKSLEESKDNSTEQLLADLTNDFEEAITAEICLRRQLVDSNLEKARNVAAHETKDIIVIKAGTGGAPEVNSTHMESPKKDKETEENASKEPNNSIVIGKAYEPKEVKTNVNETGESKIKEHDRTEDAVADTANTKKKLLQHSDVGARAQILSVEELPPISTDSTMSASEAEDNIEERLSQLDGSSTTVTNTIVTGTSMQVPHTQPKTNIPQQSMQIIQEQLQQSTSPTVHITQQITHQTFTPHSNNSTAAQLGNNTNLPQACGDLEDQDLEEVLKALKGFDGNAGFDGDLNNLFNEVYTTLNYDEMTTGNANATQTISVVPAATISCKASPLKDSQVEIEKNHTFMQRRIDNLLKRIRKIQARHMCKHTSEEIAGLFEWSSRHCSKGLTSNTAPLSEQDELTLQPFKSIISARPAASSWTEEKKSLLPLRQVSIFMRRLDTVATAQQMNAANASKNTNVALHALPIRRSKKMQESISAIATNTTTTVNERKVEEVVPTYDIEATEEMAQVAGLLQAEIREVQNAYDSDATESSSGGESSDEMVVYNNQLQQTRSIAKRSPYRYSRDRGTIASRWCWLVSQVADLEIRIRQLQELNHEVRRSKGAVVCDLENTVKQQVESAKIVNGYKSEILEDINEADALPDSSRTRGYSAISFRKRKLLQTTNIHTISKKAARPSTIKCGCQWPLHPCALCTGRADPTAPRDPPDTMMKPERVALLDPCYHPVLSFPEDVTTTIHFEAIAGQAEWQLRVMRCQAKSIAKSVWKAEREAAAAAGHSITSRRYGEPVVKRRYIKKKDRLAGERAAAADAIPLGNAGLTTSLKHDGGNGTGILSTTSTSTTTTSTTTPLVANNVMKPRKNRHCQLSEEAASKVIQLKNSNRQLQTSDYSQLKYDQYNHKRAHSSLISNINSNSNSSRNLKYNQRKHSILTTSTTTSAYQQQNQTQQIFNSLNSNYNNNQFLNGSNSGDVSDNWDRSRTSSPTHGQPKNERTFDRRNRGSYDIDNIVIPYSVAAATRVEILPYKEIPTPKWRLIEDPKNSKKADDPCEHTGKDDTVPPQETTDTLEVLNNGNNTANAEDFNCLNMDAINKADTISSHNKEITSVECSENTETANTTQNLSNALKPTNDVESLVSTEQRDVKQLKEIEEEPAAKKLKTEEPIKPECISNLAVAAPEPAEVKTNSINIIEGIKFHEVVEEKCGNSEQLLPPPPPPPPLPTLHNIIEKQLEPNISLLNSNFLNDEEELEDITDDAMILRHERALAEERRKFQTFLKFPWSTRSRANRRMDSRTESSGANTPDPASPAPRTPSVGGGDNDSIPSPSAPSTPLTMLESITEINEQSVSAKDNPLNQMGIFNSIHKRYERRRTTSTKKETHEQQFHYVEMPPYEPLKFPLSDELYQHMLSVMPNNHTDGLQSSSTSITLGVHNDLTIIKQKVNCDVNLGSCQQRSTLKSMFKSRPGRKRGRKCSSQLNGKATTTEQLKDFNGPVNADDIDEDDDNVSDYFGDGDDEDYPKHHLASSDNINGIVNYHNNIDEDEAYNGYVDSHKRLINSDGESSESEPFQDDDINDPEWKGGTEERTERTRRK